MNGKREHGGNIVKIRRQTGVEGLIDFSANINPLGPPEWLRSLIAKELENVIHYPDPENRELSLAISKYLGVNEANIVAGNGTSELLYSLMRVLKCNRVIIPIPCYLDYHHSARIAGHEIVDFPMLADNGFQLDLIKLGSQLEEGDLVIIGCPNNPTGVLPDIELLKKCIKSNKNTTFVIDEAFLDFVEGCSSFGCFADNVITLNSLTKFYAIPGLRLGFLSASPEIISKIKENSPSWNVNFLAQKVGVKALSDISYQQKTIQYFRKTQKEFYNALSTIKDIEIIDSVANFFLLRLKNFTSEELKEKMVHRGIIIRSCSNYEGLDKSYFRIAVKSKRENEQFLTVLKTVVKRPETGRIKKKTSSIMVQGTCSNVGKSVVTAALCRIFLQDGIDVAPFKAQNMSLNSFVTMDGGEMGRAQVVQAQAAKLTPDWRMNPVLLKPNSDTGSQVIVHGKPVANMNVHQYHKYKSEAWQKITQAYDELSSQHDLMILEGAGSPGEVNLKKHDIVNMKMADYAEAPVLLVGDIDRGGVYASFVGTMEVLAEWERKLVCGFLVNKFRGDQSLLASAHEYVKQHTGKDVLGVIPYFESLGLPEEDSVSFKLGGFTRQKPDVEHVVVGVINLPHISNFTDFEPFLEEPDVHLQIINHADELCACDAIILPGSKNVIGDLAYLKNNDLFEGIRKFAESGKTIVGICGGYQILGASVADNYAVESEEKLSEGLGLLKISTEMAQKKTLTRKSGYHRPSKKQVCGYEIHHGITKGEVETIFFFNDSSSCGSSSNNNKIWGAYLHGMFDMDEFRRWFIDDLRKRKGYQAVGEVLYHYDLEKELDSIAKIVRENLDMENLYNLIKI